MRGRELQNEATPFCMSQVYYMFWERWFYMFLILLNDVWCKGTAQNGETCHILRHHCFLGSTADHKCLEAWCAVLAAAATSGGMAESCFSFSGCAAQLVVQNGKRFQKPQTGTMFFVPQPNCFDSTPFGCLVIVLSWILIWRSACVLQGTTSHKINLDKPSRVLLLLPYIGYYDKKMFWRLMILASYWILLISFIYWHTGQCELHWHQLSNLQSPHCRWPGPSPIACPLGRDHCQGGMQRSLACRPFEVRYKYDLPRGVWSHAVELLAALEARKANTCKYAKSRRWRTKNFFNWE